MCLGKVIIGGYLLFVVILIFKKIYNVFLSDLYGVNIFFYGYIYIGN